MTKELKSFEPRGEGTDGNCQRKEGATRIANSPFPEFYEPTVGKIDGWSKQFKVKSCKREDRVSASLVGKGGQTGSDANWLRGLGFPQ